MDIKQEGDSESKPNKKSNQGSIERDAFIYVLEIQKNMRNNEDDEAQTIMADNFLESTAEQELEFTLHPVASKVIEGLIGHSSPENFETFTAALLPSLRLLVNASSASFVLESCLKTAALRTMTVKQEKHKEPEDSQPDSKKRKFSKVSSSVDFNLKSDIKPGHKLYCRQLVEKLSRFLLNNMEDYLYENNANHLLRSCLYCLAGILSQKNRFNKVELINIKSQHAIPVPEEWSEILGEFATRLMSWPQFPDLAFDESSSVVLQVLCETLKNVDGQSGTLKKLVKAVMKKSFKDEDDAEESETKEPVEFKAFSSHGSTHLLETMMAACDEKLLNKIYKKYFKDQLVDLSTNAELNYSVQRLIDAMADKETFEEIFNTLTPEFTNLCQIGYTGVVLAVCKACERLGVKQGQFIQSLLKSLECAAEKTSKCIVPIITLTPLPIVEERNIKKITLHGSLILQRIFQFNKPIKIVQSLLDMKPQDIADIFCDDKGSRIADAYLESKFIGEKSREKLIKQLEGMYMNMAVSKSGSHVLEKFYKLSSDGQKEAIVMELAERLNQLNGCVSGRILNYKFSVEAYSRNPNQWKNFLARKSTTKSL